MNHLPQRHHDPIWIIYWDLYNIRFWEGIYKRSNKDKNKFLTFNNEILKYHHFLTGIFHLKMNDIITIIEPISRLSTEWINDWYISKG